MKLKSPRQIAGALKRKVTRTFFHDMDESIKVITPKKPKGRVALLAYMAPENLRVHENVRHTNIQEFKCIVNTLLEHGFVIDCVDGCVRNDACRPRKRYDLIFDIHNMNDWCDRHQISAGKFVLYSTGGHPAFTNAALIARILEIYQTYGVEMDTVRFCPIPHAWGGVTDFAHCGDAFHVGTFGKKILPLPKHRVLLSCFATKREAKPAVDLNRPSFVYVGGAGFVWKGVDLLIRLFQKRTDWDLHIFSYCPFEQGVDQLFPGLTGNRYANIKVYGAVDFNDDRILACIEKSTAILCPSFADGCNSSVINGAIRGGLPIVSPECGLNDMSSVLITEKTGAALEKHAEKLLTLNAAELNALKMQASREFATRFTMENYKKSMENIISA
jgi:hypothetical protein